LVGEKQSTNKGPGVVSQPLESQGYRKQKTYFIRAQKKRLANKALNFMNCLRNEWFIEKH
jgi:hypothetical protein